MRRFITSTIAVAALALAACSGGQKAEGGSVRLGVSTAAVKGDVANVIVTVFDGATQIQQLTLNKQSTSTYTGLFTTLPAGKSLTFNAVAYNGAAPPVALYSGSGTATPVANSTISLTIFLNELKPTPFQNNAPVITSLLASTDTVVPGGTILFTVAANDPDGDPLTYAWSATGGSIPGTLASATWTAPSDPGVYTITVRVSDNRGGLTMASFDVLVTTTAATGDVQIVASINDAPRVDSMSLTPSDGTNSFFTIRVGASDNETATNLLTYAWASSCGGAISDRNAANITFDAAGMASGTLCSLQVTVSDANLAPDGTPAPGTNTGTISFYVGAPPSNHLEAIPVFAGASSPSALVVGQAATFSVRFIITPPAVANWSTDFSGDTKSTPYPLGVSADQTDAFTVNMPVACPPGGHVQVFANVIDTDTNQLSTYTFNQQLFTADLLPCP